MAALPIPRGWAVELYLDQERTREIGWADGRPKDQLSTLEEGVALRALWKGRVGFASGGDSSAEGVLRLWERARAAAQVLPPDKARRLPVPNPTPAPVPGIGPDPRLFLASPSRLEGRLSAMEKSLRRSDKRIRRALSLAFHESGGRRAVVSTRGVAFEEPFGSVSFSLELLGESGKESQSAWGSTSGARWKDLAVDETLRDVRTRLLDSFGAGPLASGEAPVIFSPRVGVEFLELLSQGVLADAVQKGRSCLAGRRGKKVGSPLVSIVDDGRRPGGLDSARWDDEGTPQQRTEVVRGGVLRSFLYDVESAARDHTRSTGNARRDGAAGLPSPSPTNFFLEPGRVSLSALLKDTPRAFWVRDVIGMHTADAVSGDFSVGAAGVLWKNGKIRRAVKSVTLAGNLLSLLDRVDAVANDLTWLGSWGAPTFRVKGLSIGGS